MSLEEKTYDLLKLHDERAIQFITRIEANTEEVAKSTVRLEKLMSKLVLYLTLAVILASTSSKALDLLASHVGK